MKFAIVRVKLKGGSALESPHGFETEKVVSFAMFVPLRDHCTEGQGSESNVALIIWLTVPKGLTMRVPTSRSLLVEGLDWLSGRTVGAATWNSSSVYSMQSSKIE